MTTPFLYQGLAVMTTAQLAEAYGVTSGILQANFSRNKEKYTEGTHFLLLAGDKLREFKRNFTACKVANNVGRLYLWTESGAYLHAKSLNTDTAWRAYGAWAAKSDGQEQVEQGEENRMNQQLQQFDFKGNNVRVVIVDGEPWFVAADVCRVLEIQNPTDALKRLDEDERARFNLGRQGETNIVNEPGLYTLILGSRKPEAKAFKRWVTHEVLPSIRKTGSYSTNQHTQAAYTQNQPVSIEDLIIMQAQSVKDLKSQVTMLEAEQAQLRSQQVQQETKVDRMTTVLTATPDRKQFQRKVNEYARLAKKGVAQAKAEVFAILEDKQGISLKVRVNNRWKKINDERVASGKKPLSHASLEKMYNRMDVIEELDLLGELMQIVAGLIGKVVSDSEDIYEEQTSKQVDTEEVNIDDNPLVRLTALCVNSKRPTLADVQKAARLFSDCSKDEKADGYNLFKAILYTYENQPA